MSWRDPEREKSLLQALDGSVEPLEGALHDYDRLLANLGDHRLVLIGDGTHGTEEFYRQRALLTQRLIAEHGFTAVAVEADWPDAWRVDRYARGLSEDEDAWDALAGFTRFPTWMWRNHAVLDFVEWLREFNDAHHEAWDAVGFYGLDLYSLHASIDAILRYLEPRDRRAALEAKARYACFDHADAGSPERYGLLTAAAPHLSCEGAVLAQLRDLQERRARWMEEGEGLAEDAFFFAEQNARLVKNAEAYYRILYQGGVSTWNLRDRHMMETVDALLLHLGQRFERPRLVLWAHNSHLGDARATSMGRAGELSLGQLARDRYGAEAYLVGFTTYQGEVTAAADWDEPPARRRVTPALEESYEALFHRLRTERFLLELRGLPAALSALRSERLIRMIGVVYRPHTERVSHYFHASLPAQFDAVVHLDTTSALEPLEPLAPAPRVDAPETYPTAF